MGTRIGEFLRHSGIYTLGNVLYRGASFLLVPLYAHYLAPAEYGTLEVFYVTAGIVQVLFSGGIAHGTLRYYYEYADLSQRNRVVSTTLLATIGSTALGVGVLLLAAPALSQAMFHSATNVLALRLLFVTLIFENSREISLAYVRARERSTFFVLVSILQLVIQVAANYYTVVVLRLGIVGILLGNLSATFTIWLLLTGSTLRSCGLKFHWPSLAAVVRYAFPLTVSGLGLALVNSADRFILNRFAGLSAIGVYALGLRIANVLPVLVVDPFSKGYGPYRFSIMNQEEARRTYSRVLSYFTMAAAGVVLALSMFSREIVHLASASTYWGAFSIVPLLVIPGALAGVTYCLQTGIYITKQTRMIFLVTIASGVTTLGLDLWLIPRYGPVGAACAALGAGLTTSMLTYLVAQRVYPVPYEVGRLLKIACLALALGSLTWLLGDLHIAAAAAVKGLLLLAFPFLLVRTGIITAEERARIAIFVSRVFARTTPQGAAAGNRS